MLKLGIGTTGKCNMHCDHCYSRRYADSSLKLTDIMKIVEVASIESINFGTGENILNDEFLEIVAYLYKKNIKLSLTTNGYSVFNMSDEDLKMFHDIDFSLEYPDKGLQNKYRGHNSWEMVISGMKRCRLLGIPFSIATVLMKPNVDHITDFYDLIKEYECNLRINVIKCNSQDPSLNDELNLSYELFWNSIIAIMSKFSLISCSEPIVCAALGVNNVKIGNPCGKASVRIQPDGSVLPCVYWGKSKIHLNDLFSSGEEILKSEDFLESQLIPDYCKKCSYIDICAGGCASRRRIGEGINTPDPFCPIARGKQFPQITFRKNEKEVDLIHSDYLCTIILGV